MPIRRSLKRQRVDDGAATIAGKGVKRPASPLVSLSRDVSPPGTRREEVRGSRDVGGSGEGANDVRSERATGDGAERAIDDGAERAIDDGVDVKHEVPNAATGLTSWGFRSLLHPERFGAGDCSARSTDVEDGVSDWGEGKVERDFGSDVEDMKGARRPGSDAEDIHGLRRPESDAEESIMETVETSEKAEPQEGEASRGQRDPTDYIASPVQLTWIRDLPDTHNIDAVSLSDILGHPLLRECWQFNYLHSIPWILQHFDPDVRSMISLKVVHGFWRTDDKRRQKLLQQADAAVRSGAQVQLIAAHMPEMFGTHHTKMMVLFRHDDVAQVVIHTANMIEQDWTNLSQAVWRSPWLPLLSESSQQEDEEMHEIGTGLRFKADLLKYLRPYEGRTRSLVNELKRYDFGSIRAALIGSVPSKIPLSTTPTQTTTAFGWPGLKQILSQIPVSIGSTQNTPQINVQISSIATLTDKWIQNLLEVLASHAKESTSGSGLKTKPKYSIIFPTAAEIRASLDGYESGASIHLKLQSSAQQKQLQLLKPMLYHWNSTFNNDLTNEERKQAFRNRAAPHIKTYVRFSNSSCHEIDWAMITSANLSQQAWGYMPDKSGVVRISSYEIGVVVWPELFKRDSESKVIMKPTFGKDMPEAEADKSVENTVMGFRMPYDIPLVPYAKDDLPWCATMSHMEPDWIGKVWGGYEDRM